MSYCNSCPRFSVLPTCTQELTIGTIEGLANEDIYVYLKNHTTGYLYRISATTTLYGGVTIDLTDDGKFKPTATHDYEIWITTQDAETLADVETVTIDGEEYLCMGVTFADVYADADQAQEYANQNLKLQS